MLDPVIHKQLNERMRGYEGSLSVLGALISDLEGVWYRETWVDKDKAEFRRLWEELEQLYGLILSRCPPRASAVEEREIKEALEGIRRVLPPFDDGSL